MATEAITSNMLSPDQDAQLMKLPEALRGALRRYVLDGIQPGGFLMSVLSNDLAGAVMRADAVNRRILGEIVEVIQWVLPQAAWGSPQAVWQWMRDRQALRMVQAGIKHAQGPEKL